MSKDRFPSIVTRYTEQCLICDAPAVHQHHCLSGKNRKFADAEQLTVGLCARCHNLYSGRPVGQSCDVHHCRKLERLMKIIGQISWEKSYLVDKYGLPFTDDLDEAREAFRNKNGECYL